MSHCVVRASEAPPIWTETRRASNTKNSQLVHQVRGWFAALSSKCAGGVRARRSDKDLDMPPFFRQFGSDRLVAGPF